MLRTKLYKPPITTEHVYREHLIEYLHKNQYKPCTLISAAAGYGKSMLISSWLDRCKCPFAWISLSKDDGDFNLFLNCINVAIRKTFPESLSNFNMLLDAAETPPFKVIEETLINDLDEINKDFVLVLDDYHHIQSEEIDSLLNSLLTFPPQHMHLVIITRRDPSINLNFLRTHSRINEIRMMELAFSEPDIAQLFNNLLVKELDARTIKSLRKTTEGWVTGLRLASFLVDKGEDADLILGKLGGDFHLLTDYLISEVLQRQPKEYQDILLVTSLLDRFNADLIDEICQLGNVNQDIKFNGKDFMQWLVKSNLFVISLDNNNEWFRYHHLFQDLLKAQLSDSKKAEEIENYHKKAAGWHKKNDFYEEAVKHALLSEDNQLAIQIILDCRTKLINREEWHRIYSFIELVPDDLVKYNPLLLISKALCIEYRGRIPEFFAMVDQIEQLLQTLDSRYPNYDRIQAEYYTIKAETCIFNLDYENAKRFSILALDTLPDDAQYIKTHAVYWYAFSHQMTNDSKAGITKVEEVLQDKDKFDPRSSARFYLALCGLYLLEGNLNMLKKCALLCLETGTKYELGESINLAYYYLISTAYYQNEFEEANKYFEAVYRNRYTSRTFYVTLCLITKAQIETSNGSYVRAWETVEKAEIFIDEIGDAVSSIIIAIFKDELTLYQNNYKFSAPLNESHSFDWPPVWFNYHPQLAKAKFLMAKGGEADLQEAHILIGKQIEHGNAVHNVNFLIPALALRALLFWKQANDKGAFESLHASLGLAAPGQYIRPFVDMGSQMLELLRDYKKSLEANDYVDTIIKALENEKSAVGTISETSTLKSSPTSFAINNELSIRELEVLKEVSQGFRNQEIAERLFVSEGTIKKHMYRMFQKWDVKNRIGLIKKGKELSLLKED